MVGKAEESAVRGSGARHSMPDKQDLEFRASQPLASVRFDLAENLMPR